jgi:hypothetical protein
MDNLPQAKDLFVRFDALFSPFNGLDYSKAES